MSKVTRRSEDDFDELDVGIFRQPNSGLVNFCLFQRNVYLNARIDKKN